MKTGGDLDKAGAAGTLSQPELMKGHRSGQAPPA